MSTARSEHIVGHRSDFPVGEPRVVRVDRREIGIFNIDGSFYGLPNICPHQTGPLCEAPRLTGTVGSTEEGGWRLEWILEGEVVVCPWHGLEFHVPSGQCLALKEIQLRRYEVYVDEADQVIVRL